MSDQAELNLTPPMSAVRNIVGKGKEQTLKNSDRLTSDAALRKYRDKHYHQLLPIIAEKVHQEKMQQEKLKEVKARLNFEGCSRRNSKVQEVSQHFESRTPNVRGEHQRGRRVGRSRSVSGSPEHASVFSRIRRDRVTAQKERNPFLKNVTMKEHVHGGRKCSPKVKIAGGGGHWKSKSKKQRSSIEDDDLSQPWVCEEIYPFTSRIRYFDLPKKTWMPNNVKTYDGTDDPEDHLKISQVAIKVERWAMPTLCHMFNSTLTKFARKYIKDPVEIHHIKQREGESTKDFVQRFKAESRHVNGALECMRIFEFMHGITNPELIKRLHDNIPKSVVEMMRVTTAFLGGENTISVQWDHRKAGVRKIQAVPSKAHGMLKFPVQGGILTLRSSRIIPLECTMVSGPKAQTSNVIQATEERIKVAIHPEYPEQRVAIGSTLTDEERKALCDLLRRNLDIFAWKPADMTGVPRHIAEHRLNMQKSLSFFKTLKRCTKKSDFQWIVKAEVAFKQMKKLIAELPTLTAPIEKEELIVYLVAAREAVSAVLMTKRGAKQMPVYFVSCTLPRTSVKGQSLADFIVKRLEDDPLDTRMEAKEELPDLWILFTDGSYCVDGSRAAKEPGMIQYLEKVKTLSSSFKKFSIKQVLVEELNEKSINEVKVSTVVEEEEDTRITPIYNYLTKETLLAEKEKARAIRPKSGRYAVINEVLYKKSYLLPWLRLGVSIGRRPDRTGPAKTGPDRPSPDWTETELVLNSGPKWYGPGRSSVRNLWVFYKIGPDRTDRTEDRIGTKPRTEDQTEIRSATYVLKEIHEGSCSMHAGTRSVEAKDIRTGYYWPTMHADARKLIIEWIDIAGLFPEGPGKVKFLIVAMDYFMKWIEAKHVATITRNQRFAFIKHPQANGLVERANRSLGEGIKARLDERSKEWIEKIPHVLWAHLTMIKSSNEDIPFSLTYGTRVVIPAEIERMEQAAIHEATKARQRWKNITTIKSTTQASNLGTLFTGIKMLTMQKIAGSLALSGKDRTNNGSTRKGSV
uniref:Uncharacterized protein n=1 Tax=Tanacetum cinerariifolium TaxID=118510 RepID=A0A6L2JLW8_TANCI|nr:hypothetical protein [Tanacetum cinerariifolium]